MLQKAVEDPPLTQWPQRLPPELARSSAAPLRRTQRAPNRFVTAKLSRSRPGRTTRRPLGSVSRKPQSRCAVRPAAPRRRAPRPCEQQQRGRHRSLSRHGRRSPLRRRLQSNRLERMRSRSFMAHSSRPAVPPALVARRFSDKAMPIISIVRQIHLVGTRHARSAGPGKRHGLMALYGRGNRLPSGRIGQYSPGQPVAAGSSSGDRCTQQANRTTARRTL